MVDTTSEISPVMTALSAYLAGALDRELPPEVVEKGKYHLLDTIAAMVSGSRLPPGEATVAYISTLGGVEDAVVVGSGIVTSAINAARKSVV